MSKLGITRPTGAVKLYRDQALYQEWEAAQQDLSADPTKDDRETGRPLAKKVSDLEARMNQTALTFHVQALPRKRFAELELEHPPRDGVPGDEDFGVNVETFFDAVMMEPGSLISVTDAEGNSVEFSAQTDWSEAADEMANGQWTLFALELFQVNRGRTSAPKSLVASAMMRNYDKD